MADELVAPLLAPGLDVAHLHLERSARPRSAHVVPPRRRPGPFPATHRSCRGPAPCPHRAAPPTLEAGSRPPMGRSPHAGRRRRARCGACPMHGGAGSTTIAHGRRGPTARRRRAHRARPRPGGRRAGRPDGVAGPIRHRRRHHGYRSASSTSSAPCSAASSAASRPTSSTTRPRAPTSPCAACSSTWSAGRPTFAAAFRGDEPGERRPERPARRPSARRSATWSTRSRAPGALDRTVAAPFGEVAGETLRPLRGARRPGPRLGPGHRHRPALRPARRARRRGRRLRPPGDPAPCGTATRSPTRSRPPPGDADRAARRLHRPPAVGEARPPFEHRPDGRAAAGQGGDRLDRVDDGVKNVEWQPSPTPRTCRRPRPASDRLDLGEVLGHARRGSGRRSTSKSGAPVPPMSVHRPAAHRVRIGDGDRAALGFDPAQLAQRPQRLHHRLVGQARPAGQVGLAEQETSGPWRRRGRPPAVRPAPPAGRRPGRGRRRPRTPSGGGPGSAAGPRRRRGGGAAPGDAGRERR